LFHAQNRKRFGAGGWVVVPPTISGGGAGYIEIYRWCSGAVPVADAIAPGAEAWRARPATRRATPRSRARLSRRLVHLTL